MATYIPKFTGYVADVPEVWFKRNDGKMFHYDKLTQASVTPQVNFTEVNAGWSLYPEAYLPAASTFEMQLTSGQFDSSLFEMANGGDFAANATMKVPYTETVLVTAGPKVTLELPEAGASAEIVEVVIPGMDSVTIGSGSASAGVPNYNNKVITFTSEDVSVGQPIEVTYYVVADNSVTLDVDNDKAAIGSAVLKWPVYNGGEVDQTATTFNGASIKGYIILTADRVRATAMPGFDTSYKSAATNAITLATMAPTKGKPAYSITFVENKA